MDTTGPPPVPHQLHSEKGAELVPWQCLSPNKKAGLELWALTLITSHSARSVLMTPSLRVSEGLSYPVSKGSFSSSSWETACPDPAAIPDVSSYKARCFRPLITGKELCKLLGESIDRSTRALIAFLAAGLLENSGWKRRDQEDGKPGRGGGRAPRSVTHKASTQQQKKVPEIFRVCVRTHTRTHETDKSYLYMQYEQDVAMAILIPRSLH